MVKTSSLRATEGRGGNGRCTHSKRGDSPEKLGEKRRGLHEPTIQGKRHSTLTKSLSLRTVSNTWNWSDDVHLEGDVDFPRSLKVYLAHSLPLFVLEV